MKDYAGSRSLRKKHSKTYVDGMSSSDEDDDMKTFDPEEKVRTKNFPPYFITELTGNLQYFLHFPIWFITHSYACMFLAQPVHIY